MKAGKKLTLVLDGFSILELVDVASADMRGFNYAKSTPNADKAGEACHAFIAENVRGKIVYIDPQTNRRYSGLNLKRVTRANVTRIDNQAFTEYAKNAFTRQKV